MALSSMDLAEFRLLRALRAGTGAAFTQLWNAQAGAVWSVFRALVERDDEALGWMASFRIELQQRAGAFRADEDLSPQVGRALYAHAETSFTAGGALPDGPLSPDEAGVRRLPAHTRLGYLVDLFFDWTPPDPGVRDAYHLLEPAGDTDARLLVHTALLRNPPAEGLILPPGVADPLGAAPPPRRLQILLGAGVATLLLLGVASWWRTRPPDPVRLHDDALSATGGVMVDSDAGRLARRLDAAGAPSGLVECPPLTGAGLQLVGARYERDVVVLLYRGHGTDWTLQHRDDGDLVGRATEGGLRVGEGEGVSFGSWRDQGGVWTLAARVAPATLEAAARDVIADRAHPPAPIDGEGDLRLPEPPPSALPFPRPEEP